MPRETDEDLLRLIEEIHGQSPLDAAEARVSHAIDETERRARLAAKRLSALTEGRAAQASASWGLGVQGSEPNSEGTPAQGQTEAEAQASPAAPEVTAVFHPPEDLPAPRELTRRVRQLPGGHVESGSGRELKGFNQELTEARAHTPQPRSEDRSDDEREV